MSPAILEQEQRANERLKDPIFFIERFLWIIDKRRVRVPFRLNPVQKKYVEERTANDLILKARKEGFSSVIEAEWLHACIFNQNENVVTMAHTLSDTMIHLDRVKFYIENMGFRDVPIEVPLDKDNQRELYFPWTNSRYWIGTAGSKAFGRGRDITKLHLSEVAHYQNAEVITGVMEACVPGARKVLETTANGVGEMFHRLWEDAGHGESPWKRHFYAWHDDPTNRIEKPKGVTILFSTKEREMKNAYHLDEEQVLWYRYKRAEMIDKAKMPQEYPSNAEEAFLSSGRHCFNLDRIREAKQFAEDPQFRCELEDDGQEIKVDRNPEGRLAVWKAPRSRSSYLIVADIAEGVPEGDWSVAHVLDRSTWEEVARWRGRINPGIFGEVLITLGQYYNWASILPEINNHGWATTEAMQRLEYPHLVTTRDLWGRGEQIKPGFPTNERTRNLAINALRKAVDERTLKINDLVTLDEMEAFVEDEGTHRFQAHDGYFDDCVMSLAIGAYALAHLSLDDTYAESSQNYRGSPILSGTVLGSNPTSEGRRRSATGYR